MDNPMWTEIENGLMAGALRLVGNVLTALGTVKELDRILGASVVIPDAGRGYWPGLLRQMDRRVAAYDRDPEASDVKRLDPRRTALRVHDSDTLLMLTPKAPFKTVHLALRHYTGNHMVLVCDRPYEATQLAWTLDSEWTLLSDFWDVVFRVGRPAQIYNLYRRSAVWNAPTQPLLRVERAL
jgi:hypothetical protein